MLYGIRKLSKKYNKRTTLGNGWLHRLKLLSFLMEGVKE